MIQRGLVYCWFFRDIYGLHQINLNLMRTLTDRADVFVDVFPFRYIGIFEGKAKQIDPQGTQTLFIFATNGNLLNA